MLKKILRFFYDVLTAIRKSFEWLYHNLFLRLWLVFAGLIGISTATTCPCCGQTAAACPAGFSLIAGLGALLALLGVFQKKTRAFLRKILPFLTETGSRHVFWGLLALTVIALSVSAFLLSGKPLVQKEWSPLQKKTVKQTSPSASSIPLVRPVSAKNDALTVQPFSSAIIQTPDKPQMIKIEKPQITSIPAKRSPNIPSPTKTVPGENDREDIKVQAIPPVQTDMTVSPAVPVPAASEEPLENAELPQQMRAVINPDGSVEISKNPEGLIRYETWNFMELNDDIFDRINAYRGKKVEIEGYVYRRSDFEPGYFVTARLYMWCCAMCAAPVGPLCQWDRAGELKDGDWIRVEGVIEPLSFRDTFEDESSDIPLIKISKVERIPKLENPYVYLRNAPTNQGQCAYRSPPAK